MSLKSVLTDILPAPLMAYAEAVKQQISLAAIAPAEFLPDSLRPSSDFLVPMVLGDSDAAASWQIDGPQIEKLVPSNDTPDNMTAGDRRALYILTRALKPASVLEVGTHHGASALYIARALKTNGGGHLTTVDIYDVNHPVPAAQKIFEQADLADKVTFRSEGAYEFLKKTDLNFDMIFLDGDHTAASVYSEVSGALRKLSPDGIVILNNYYPDGKALFTGEAAVYGPYLGMRRVMSEHKDVHVIPLGELPWPTRPDSAMTTLAVVVKHAV